MNAAHTSERFELAALRLNGKPAGDEIPNPIIHPERMPPGQTHANRFPHLEYATVPRDVDWRSWDLRIGGAVHRVLVMKPPFLLGFPGVSVTQDFHCITGWSVLDTEWQGVKGSTISRMARHHEDVVSVMIHGLDNFCTAVTIEQFNAGLLALGYRGQPLSPEHGFPLRFIAPPDLYQFKSCKWVTAIEFLTEHRLGFWEQRAYSDTADVWADDRYTSPEFDGKTAGQIRRRFTRPGGRGSW